MSGGGCAGAMAMADERRRRRFSPLIGALVLLGNCSHRSVSDEELNVAPTDYRADILGAMRVYLNDPTGIRDGAISPLMLKSVNNANRYIVCVRYNAKKNAKEYAGVKEIAAVYVAGHFDHFVDKVSEPCGGATYAPFPELAKLSR